MYTVRIFMKCMHVCAAQKRIYSIKPDFPSLADEIAEPHPDMNIKVAALTVSEKSGNNNLYTTGGRIFYNSSHVSGDCVI